ncbi:MAG TPA: hypothetical protein VGM10_13195 [Actinocrinis sp.]
MQDPLTAETTANGRDGGTADRVVRPRGWAKTVTDILSPAHLVIALPPTIGWHATYPGTAGLWWGAFCSGLAGGVPYGFVLWGVRRRRFSDIHIKARRERYVPIMVAVAAMGLCVAVLVLGGAPRALEALLAALLSAIAVGGVITVRWKISGHSCAASGAVGICAVCFGAWVLAFAPVVLVIGAARVRLRDHTAAQVAAGIALGAIVPPAVMYALL